jgi:hypothetical protein
MFGRQLFDDARSLKPGIVWGSGDWQCNGASAPSATTFRGSLGQTVQSSAGAGAAFTVTRSGVGVYVVTMAAQFTFVQPPIIESANCYDGTTSFWTNVELPAGGWSNATRSFTIHAWNNAGAAVDPANDARNRVSFYLEGIDCSGR